jgi:hypothetical protein
VSYTLKWDRRVDLDRSQLDSWFTAVLPHDNASGARHGDVVHVADPRYEVGSPAARPERRSSARS